MDLFDHENVPENKELFDSLEPLQKKERLKLTPIIRFEEGETKDGKFIRIKCTSEQRKDPKIRKYINKLYYQMKKKTSYIAL